MIILTSLGVGSFFNKNRAPRLFWTKPWRVMDFSPHSISISFSEITYVSISANKVFSKNGNRDSLKGYERGPGSGLPRMSILILLRVHCQEGKGARGSKCPNFDFDKRLQRPSISAQICKLLKWEDMII
ncbi:hypothetical protein ACP275_14G135700 [Erythranthe tilingii]